VAERWPAERADSPVPPPELLSLDVFLTQYYPAVWGWDHHCDSHAADLFLKARFGWESRGWVPGPADVREGDQALMVASRFCRDCI